MKKNIKDNEMEIQLTIKLLDEIEYEWNKMNEAHNMIDFDKSSFRNKIMNSGFLYENNTYLGLVDEIKYGLELRIQKSRKTHMFKDLVSWHPSLKKYIEFLQEWIEFNNSILQEQHKLSLC